MEPQPLQGESISPQRATTPNLVLEGNSKLSSLLHPDSSLDRTPLLINNQYVYILLTENYEMLKAMYDFQANYPKTISFDEGEFFILHNQSSVRQRNWWQVVSMKGNIGFVPSNYVTNLKVSVNWIADKIV